MASPEEVAARLNAREWEKRRKATYRNLAKAMEAAAKDEAPVNTGALREDLEGYVTSSKKEPIKVRARTKGELLGWITKGTPPHTIEASSAGALHWVSGGQDFFARIVEHPGTEPNDFLARAAENAADDLEGILHEAAEEYLEWVARA